MPQHLRNICIIAHVDHGKTTLVDHILRQAGTFQAHESLEERVMDSDAQERERGITISAKNAAFHLKDVKVNIVDTPGHADFGGEVERIMGMVDGAVLLVDAAEGPLPQTRFVLQKAIARGLKIILCINKVDRPEVRDSNLVDETVNKVFDLFVELNASDEQCDFPIVYACAREGWCTRDTSDIPKFLAKEARGSLSPLFNLILELPPPKLMSGDKASLLVSNLGYSDFLGALAIGRVMSGKLKTANELVRYGVDSKGAPVAKKFKILKLLSFLGLKQVDVDELEAGDIGLVAGCEEVQIGDTLGDAGVEVLPRIKVEEPTMRMIFSVNTTPNSGKEGKAVQSRELRERLLKEVRSNVALRLEDTDQPDQYYVLGRGELQFGILIEKMRREGFEFMVGRPNVVYKIEDGKKLEPIERLVLDLPEWASGDVTRMYQERKGVMASFDTIDAKTADPRVRLVFEIPTRGILGTHSSYLTATKGLGLMSSETIGYKDFSGDMVHRINGSLVSDRSGKTTEYALFSLQERGVLFVDPGVDVYEGMIIGEHAKEQDLNVNAVREKKLTNVRAAGSDGLLILAGTRKMSLERCIEWIEDDEWIEVTPKNVRLRKKVLAQNLRSVKR